MPSEKISPARQLECLTGLADAYAARGEYARARELYQNALNMPAAEQGRAKLLYSLGVAAYHLSNNSQAVDFQQQSLELARKDGDIKQQAHASGGLGLAYWNLGDLEKAEENLQLSRSFEHAAGGQHRIGERGIQPRRRLARPGKIFRLGRGGRACAGSGPKTRTYDACRGAPCSCSARVITV